MKRPDRARARSTAAPAEPGPPRRPTTHFTTSPSHRAESPVAASRQRACNNSTPSPTALTGGQPGYTVATGYDLVTGWGSLDVANFVTAFLAASNEARGLQINPSAVTVAAGSNATVALEPTGFLSPLTYLRSGLPEGDSCVFSVDGSGAPMLTVTTTLPTGMPSAGSLAIGLGGLVLAARAALMTLLRRGRVRLSATCLGVALGELFAPSASR